jgi:hypothetical protein
MKIGWRWSRSGQKLVQNFGNQLKLVKIGLRLVKVVKDVEN